MIEESNWLAQRLTVRVFASAAMLTVSTRSPLKTNLRRVKGKVVSIMELSSEWQNRRKNKGRKASKATKGGHVMPFSPVSLAMNDWSASPTRGNYDRELENKSARAGRGEEIVALARV